MWFVKTMLWLLRATRDLIFWIFRTIRNFFAWAKRTVINLVKNTYILAIKLCEIIVHVLKVLWLGLCLLMAQIKNLWVLNKVCRANHKQRQIDLAQLIYEALEEKKSGNDQKCDEIIHIATIQYGKKRVEKVIDSILQEEGSNANLRDFTI